MAATAPQASMKEISALEAYALKLGSPRQRSAIHSHIMSQIPNLKAQLRIRPPARHDASYAPSQCFDILKYGEFYALDSLGSKFAILSKKLCQDIQALQQNRDLHLRAFVSRDQWLQAVQEWYEEKDAAVVAFDMNIYGRRLQATEVGRALSSAKLFLQRPLHGTHGILYYNPHYLHTDEILGNEVLETPVIFPEEQSDESLVEIHEQRSPTEEVCQPNDAEIDTILNSLSHHSFLVKSAADKRIKSSLLEYVWTQPRMSGQPLTVTQSPS